MSWTLRLRWVATRANAVEDIFRTLRAGQRLHGDIGIGQDAAHRLGNGSGELPGALESDGARESDGKSAK